MTQEQKIRKGTLVIFILSIILVFCLCAATTLAYFAGKQDNHTVLVMGGPVTVTMVDNSLDEDTSTLGKGNLHMELKSNRGTLLPGMGIDMQAIAKVKSTQTNSTNALLRAILDIEVKGIDNETYKSNIKKQIIDSMGECLTHRIDSSESNAQDGWVQYDGDYYYCDQFKEVDLITGEEVIKLKSINTSQIGANVTFINGTFQFPYKFYVNNYADVEITFTLTFQAIQDTLIVRGQDGIKRRVVNNIANVKKILDSMTEEDWNKHNADSVGLLN